MRRDSQSHIVSTGLHRADHRPHLPPHLHRPQEADHQQKSTGSRQKVMK